MRDGDVLTVLDMMTNSTKMENVRFLLLSAECCQCSSVDFDLFSKTDITDVDKVWAVQMSMSEVQYFCSGWTVCTR